LISVLLISHLPATQSQSSCGVGPYDFSALILPNSPGTEFYNVTSAGLTYYFNICGEVTSEFCSSVSGTSVCQTGNSTTPQIGCGVLSSMNITEGLSSGAQIEYSNGEICTSISGSPGRKTFIYLYCASSEISISSFYEYNCTYSIYVYTIYACLPSATATVSVSPSPYATLAFTSSPIPVPSSSPLPTSSQVGGGANACNAIKVKTFPETITSNTELYGASYNATCIDGYSAASQFYLVRVESESVISATTCGLTSVDTVLRVYRSDFCSDLGECIAFNDDGCVNTQDNQSTVTVDVLPNRDYFFEVRAYGSSVGGPYAITFSIL